MQLPPSCVEWRDKMDSGEQSRHVLRNIKRDACVPPDVEKKFFNRLAAKGPFAGAQAAWNAAKEVVNENPEMFYCSGELIGADAFALVLRFVMVSDWKYLLPKPQANALEEDLRRRFSITGPAWPDGLTDRQRKTVCDELTQDLQIGRPNRIAWVADADQTPRNESGSRQVLRCLGLPYFEGESWAIVLCYRRMDVPRGLYVPRALDAIENWPFWVQGDCSATVGSTKPTDEAGPDADGYPEAVHRSDVIPVQTVELKAIDGDSAPSS